MMRSDGEVGKQRLQGLLVVLTQKTNVQSVGDPSSKEENGAAHHIGRVIGHNAVGARGTLSISLDRTRSSIQRSILWLDEVCRLRYLRMHFTKTQS